MAYRSLEQLSRLHDGYRQAFTVAGKHLLLVQSEGSVYVIENRCPHMDVALTNGDILPGKIRCRAHGIEFELGSGRACGPLAGTLSGLVKYPLIYEGSTIGIDI